VTLLCRSSVESGDIVCTLTGDGVPMGRLVFDGNEMGVDVWRRFLAVLWVGSALYDSPRAGVQFDGNAAIVGTLTSRLQPDPHPAATAVKVLRCPRCGSDDVVIVGETSTERNCRHCDHIWFEADL
jgi:hypothetical protein